MDKATTRFRNRIVNLIAGIMMMAIYFYTATWACGLALPQGLVWHARWPIALATAWVIALFFVSLTEEGRLIPATSTTFFLGIWGPFSTMRLIWEKLANGEPLCSELEASDDFVEMIVNK